MKQKRFLLSALLTAVIAIAATFTFAACNKQSAPPPSEGLEYELSYFGDFYILTGMGTCTDENVVIPSSYSNLPVQEIAKEAFAYNTFIKSVVIPDSITSIEADTFNGCTGIERVTLGGGVTSVGNRAFEGCTSLKSITIPDRVTSVGESAFCDCTSLESAVIGYRVTSIGNFAFEGCTSLKSIAIPDRVVEINRHTFDGCSVLESVTLGNKVQSLGDWAFYNCTNLKSITIPVSVTKIGYFTFENCSQLESVYYKGTAEQWDSINIISGKYFLNNATRYYYSENYPFGDDVTEGNFWHYANGKIEIWTK